MHNKAIIVIFAVLAPGAAAQTQVISSESFDYPAGDTLGGKTGGFGWLFPWWSGTNLDDALIQTPGVDVIGEQVSTSNENAGSYRLLDYTNFSHLADAQFRFGIDNTTFWISFWTQQAAASTDEYGGFSFNEQLVAEKLFIGSPWQTGLLGIQAVGAPSVTIAGTDPMALSRMVVRVEHLSGDENIKVWIDPAVTHPDPSQFPPDLDEMVPDFVWNEIRLQSGSNQGGVTGWYFDDLLIEVEEGNFPNIGVNYCLAENNSTGIPAVISASGVDQAGGQPLFLAAADLPLGEFGYFLASQAAGFIPNPGGSQGHLCITGLMARFNAQIQNSGTSGQVQIPVDTNAIPMPSVTAILPGETWNFQYWYRDLNPTPTSNFTDGIAILFQ
jgi:hypothetical protein